MTLFSKHCPKCDSENIFGQTYWTWSVEEQEWKSDDDNAITCTTCGHSFYTCVTKKVLEPRTKEQE